LSTEDKQLDQRQPPDRRLEVVPSPVGGDAHVEIAAKRRVPKVDGWRPFAPGIAGGAGDRLKTP
jgi:hypothetical protein